MRQHTLLIQLNKRIEILDFPPYFVPEEKKALLDSVYYEQSCQDKYNSSVSDQIYDNFYHTQQKILLISNILLHSLYSATPLIIVYTIYSFG